MTHARTQLRDAFRGALAHVPGIERELGAERLTQTIGEKPRVWVRTPSEESVAVNRDNVGSRQGDYRRTTTVVVSLALTGDDMDEAEDRMDGFLLEIEKAVEQERWNEPLDALQDLDLVSVESEPVETDTSPVCFAATMRWSAVYYSSGSRPDELRRG